MHLSTWDDGSISRWQGRQTPLSPLSIRSEERNPSSLGSAESPTGSRISIVRRTGETEKRESMGTESRWNETRLEETPASFSTTSPVYSALKQPSQAEIQPSREREDKSSLQETAIWELRNLPVSPFIPGPNPDLFGPLQGNTLDPNTQVPPQEMDCAFPATSSSAEVVFPVSGLELNQFPSHTPPPKVPVDDRETYSTLREGSVRSAHSSRHQKAPSGDSQDYKGHAVPELDALKPTPTSSSASITSEKKARFFGFRRPTKQSLGPLPSGLRYQFSNCARYIMLWCKTNPEYIVRITHPFNSGSTFPIYLPTGTETKPHVRRDIRYLACTEDLIATLLHIESVSNPHIVTSTVS